MVMATNAHLVAKERKVVAVYSVKQDQDMMAKANLL